MNVLAEQRLCRFAKTMHCIQAMLAEINLVRVHCEDLFFRQPQLEKDRNECFRNLAAQCWLTGQEKASCELLRDCAGALQAPVFTNVPDERTGDPFHIQTMMNEKLLILTRCDGIEKHLR